MYLSMKIHKSSLADWGMDEDEAYENALSNTYSLSPPRIYKWERLLFNPAYEGEDFMDMNYEENIVERNAGSCLSTSIRTNGAVAVFCRMWHKGSQTLWMMISTLYLQASMRQ